MTGQPEGAGPACVHCWVDGGASRSTIHAPWCRDGADLGLAFLGACAEVREAAALEASALARKRAAATEALRLARKMTSDPELDDEAATRAAWELALERVREEAKCPS